MRPSYMPHLFQRGRRPDQQTRSVRTGNDEQADHDQGKSEGGEERALSCSAEDPGETGGEGEIWSELRTLTFLILIFSHLNSTRTTPLHQSQCMFCYVLPLSKSLSIYQQVRKLFGGAILFIFQHKKTVVKVKSHEIKRIENIGLCWQTR